MNNRQRIKRSFRDSKKWKDFRHQKNVEQKGIDPITGMKLGKNANLHHKHLNLDEEKYQDITNPSDFIFLSHNTHKVLHWFLQYVKKYGDTRVIDNMKDELIKESVLNGYM